MNTDSELETKAPEAAPAAAPETPEKPGNPAAPDGGAKPRGSGQAGRVRRSSILASRPLEPGDGGEKAAARAGSPAARPGNHPSVVCTVATRTDEARRLLSRTFAGANSHLTFLTLELYAMRQAAAWSACSREIDGVLDRLSEEVAKAAEEAEAALGGRVPGWRCAAYPHPTANDVEVGCAGALRLTAIFEALDRLFQLKHTEAIFGLISAQECFDSIHAWEKAMNRLVSFLGEKRKAFRGERHAAAKEQAAAPAAAPAEKPETATAEAGGAAAGD